MNPTPDQIASIRAFVAGLAGGWSNTDAQVRAAMATTLVPNPVATAPQLPKPFTVDDLTGAAGISATNQANIATLATTMPDFLRDIDAQDVSRLRRWGRLLLKIGKLLAAEANILQAIVTATQADPSWTATVPWDVANLGRTADDYDIEAARPRG